MKRRMMLLFAAVLLCLAGCKGGNTLFQGMSLDNAALEFDYAADPGSFTRSLLYQHEDQKKAFLKDLSMASAKPVESWSFEDITFPIYGFSLMDADRFEKRFAWSNGILYTPDGKKYKFQMDFEKIRSEYPFDEEDTFAGLNWFPLAQQFILSDGQWNKAMMNQGQDPTGEYDVDYEVISQDTENLTVRFTNHMEDVYTFGEYFYLQVQLDGTWYEVPAKDLMSFHDLAYELSPEQSYEMTYYIAPYGTLPAGHYRVLNGIGLPSMDLAAEFDLK